MNWTGENEFEIDGFPFFIRPGDYRPGQGDANRFHILKNRAFFAVYDGLFAAAPIKSMIELGFFDGGSTLYFLKKYPIDKLLSVDIRKTPPDLVTAIESQKLSHRVRIASETSQDDGEAIRRHHAEFMGGAPVDLIVDDASHFYELTKRSFEVCFPLLRPGGYYVFEDWCWPHLPGTQPGGAMYDAFKDKIALSNVLFLMQILMVSQPGLIADIHVHPNCAVIKRGNRAVDGPLDMEKMCLNRGKPFHIS